MKIKTAKEKAAARSPFAVIDFWKKALSDDCAGLKFQLDNIKIPAGGATMFELPGENEDTETLI